MAYMNSDRGNTTRRKFLATSGLVTAGTIAGCVSDEPDDTDDAAPGDPANDNDDVATHDTSDDSPIDWNVETVVEGLNHPWGMSFVPDSSILLVTERAGQLLRIDLETSASESVEGVPSVHASGQGGLLDLCVWDDGSEMWIYLTYAVTEDEGATTAIGRGILAEGADRIESFDEFFQAEPVVDSTQHFGSRVVMAPDSSVFMTVGDRGSKNFGDDHTSQRLDTDLGAVLRFEPDGSIPSDNPFVDDPDANDAIYSFGHRNPQGLTIHPETEELWISDHGEQDGDSIAIIEEGGNHGWPIAHYGCTYDDESPIGDAPDERDDVVDPVYYWECNSGGFPPAGMTFYTGDAFPDWTGDLFVGNLAGEYLGRFNVTDESVAEESPLLADDGWRIRDVIVGPGGDDLYVAVDAASAPIVRITPDD